MLYEDYFYGQAVELDYREIIFFQVALFDQIRRNSNKIIALTRKKSKTSSRLAALGLLKIYAILIGVRNNVLFVCFVSPILK